MGPRLGEMQPEFPPVQFNYLQKWLEDLGWCESDGMGARGISWPALAAWSQLSGNDVDPWEAECLHAASTNYAAYWAQAKDPMCPCPWDGARTDASVLSNQIKKLFDGMIASQQKKREKG